MHTQTKLQIAVGDIIIPNNRRILAKIIPINKVRYAGIFCRIIRRRNLWKNGNAGSFTAFLLLDRFKSFRKNCNGDKVNLR